MAKLVNTVLQNKVFLIISYKGYCNKMQSNKTSCLKTVETKQTFVGSVMSTPKDNGFIHSYTVAKIKAMTNTMSGGKRVPLTLHSQSGKTPDIPNFVVFLGHPLCLNSNFS